MNRFTIEFSEKADKELDEIAKRLGVKNKIEVIRKALALMNFVTQEQAEGSKLFLDNVSQNIRRKITAL